MKPWRQGPQHGLISVKGPSLVQEKKIPMYGIRTYTYLVVLKVTAEVLVSWV